MSVNPPLISSAASATLGRQAISGVRKIRNRMRVPAATRLATLNPALAVNLGDRLGSLVPGKKADMILVERIGAGFPVVTRVVVDGRTIMTTDYRAA